MIICICNGISEKDMKESVKDGHRDFDEMLKSKNACFQCYICEEVAREKFNFFVENEYAEAG